MSRELERHGVRSFHTGEADICFSHREVARSILTRKVRDPAQQILYTLDDFSQEPSLIATETDKFLSYSQLHGLMQDTLMMLDLHAVRITLCKLEKVQQWYDDHAPAGFVAFGGLSVAAQLYTSDLTTATMIKMSF